ncbi:DHH family phosphoesterase [Candidatus Woesearchaeota archaeon]|nr:DHH family phosphoesterase [Candidatus Woesearchaeota archaeon]
MNGHTREEKYTKLDFLNLVSDNVNKFIQLNKNNYIKIVSHIDCDGISSTSIIAKAFEREDFRFSIANVKQIDIKLLDKLSKENFDILFLLDLGSDYMKEIEERFSKPVFILDHHKFNYKGDNVNLVNPHLFNLSYEEISSSGICYLFAKCLNDNNKDLAYLALIGAIGDMQEKNGFSGINSLILEDAKEKIDIEKGPRFFGMQTKPINKVLEYCTDPYIPNVTGSSDGAIRFLDDLEIDARDENGRFKRLIDLDKEDIQKIIAGVIVNRLDEENPEDIFGNIYTIKDEEKGTSMKDLKEFSTLLNAVGRFDKTSLGIRLCLNDKESRKESAEILNSYKSELINSLNWFNSNKNNFIFNNLIIINAKDNVKDTMIGTLASIVAKSNAYDKGTIIVGMAYTKDNDIKISARICGYINLDLRSMLKEIVSRIGDYPCGGHKAACGALIPKDKEEEFIKGLLDTNLLTA